VLVHNLILSLYVYKAAINMHLFIYLFIIYLIILVYGSGILDKTVDCCKVSASFLEDINRDKYIVNDD
jgi:hypothetical protein